MHDNIQWQTTGRSVYIHSTISSILWIKFNYLRMSAVKTHWNN